MTESPPVIRRTKLWLLVGLLGLLTWGLAASPAKPPAKPAAAQPIPAARPLPALRFLALGDSYTIGERVVPAARWPLQLAALLRARGVSIGEPEIVARTGWTVDDLAVALERSEPSGPYDLVSLQIGVNDQYQGRSAEVYRGELRVMLRRAIAYAGGRAERVIVLSIPDWSVTPFAAHLGRPEIAAELARFNAVDREETLRAGARFVDVTPETRDAGKDPALIADDGLHPAPAMYAAWARLALGAALAALGAEALPPAPLAPGTPPSGH